MKHILAKTVAPVCFVFGLVSTVQGCNDTMRGKEDFTVKRWAGNSGHRAGQNAIAIIKGVWRAAQEEQNGELPDGKPSTLNRKSTGRPSTLRKSSSADPGQSPAPAGSDTSSSPDPGIK